MTFRTPEPAPKRPEAPPAASQAPWHTLGLEDLLARLEVDPAGGLTDDEADARRARHGPNEIAEGKRRAVAAILLSQFADFMILVLLAAAVVSGLVGDLTDTVAILVIVTLNAVIGAVQEARAEQAIAALRRMAAPEAQVQREGRVQTIPGREVVPGDVVLLEAGRVVPADLRLLEVADLHTDESALTGESEPVAKRVRPIEDPEAPIGDRRNMVYKGTTVTRGRARGLVVATGMATELGRIAALLHGAEAVKTPLQQRLARFGRRLALVVLAVCAVVFAFGLARGEPVVTMFLTAVSLAVAAIPEALPAVVTVSLALGARKMARRRALVRRLPAVETLGSVTYICSDKTGTLTRNSMRLQAVWGAGRRLEALPQEAGLPWSLLGEALVASNDVRAEAEPVGEPTEVGLYLGGRDAGFDKADVERRRPRIAEIPFTSERKLMTTVHRTDEGLVAFTKGAPERVLDRTRAVLFPDGERPLDRAAVQAEVDALAEAGHRVLAVAVRRHDREPEPLDPEAVERDLVLLGLVGLMDPPRPEVPDAVAECVAAGITPVMITGDHPGTARAVARRVGIADEESRSVTGRDLDALSEADLARQVGALRVYARVSPEQKIKIVEALRARGEFIAMTGDGVNDAPALKRADIGVAMGLKGTDVAREAADMVLLDDNFATIVSAVREGRRIYDNIRKFVKYTMTSNSGEIWTLLLAPFFGLPIPLLPIQILWVNLVTDGLPGLAFAAEPEERALMRRPPRPPDESIFAHGMWQHMIWAGLLIGGLSIGSQLWAVQTDRAAWQTVVFTVLTFSQLVHALVIRSERESLLTQGLMSNRPLLGAVVLTVGLQLAVIYVPFLQPIFGTRPLGGAELLVCAGLPLVVGVAVELEKLGVRRLGLYGAGRS